MHNNSNIKHNNAGDKADALASCGNDADGLPDNNDGFSLSIELDLTWPLCLFAAYQVLMVASEILKVCK